MRALIPRAFVLLALVTGCGGGATDGQDAGQDGQVLPCDLGAQACPAGERCDRDQTCVPAEALVIATAELQDGRVGFPLQADMQAQGGLPPYRWELARADPALGFLSLSTAGRLSGTPSEAVVEASLTVAVLDDGYGGGERVERTLALTIATCREGDTLLCYAPEGGACHQGAQTCTGGIMGACVVGANLSADRRQCGPECGECDAAVSDGCVAGLCACGAGDPCQGGARCCQGICVDVSAEKAHCGACFHDCAQAVAHLEADTAFCQDGLCDYDGGCANGWADCDADRSNGCEGSVSVLEACGDCSRDCNALLAHLPSAQKRCLDQGAGLGFACDYIGACSADFADCDLDRADGCEAWLAEPAHCGDCGVDCRGLPTGELCQNPFPGEPWVCGCHFDSATYTAEGCPAGGALCCERICRDGAVDPAHCGVCGAACTAGACRDGACACGSDADCPAPSGGTACGLASACVCLDLAPGDATCPIGQYCCDGNQGGSGGPDQGEGPGPDLGCCPKLCGQNDTDADFVCTQ